VSLLLTPLCYDDIYEVHALYFLLGSIRGASWGTEGGREVKSHRRRPTQISFRMLVAGLDPQSQSSVKDKILAALGEESKVENATTEMLSALDQLMERKDDGGVIRFEKKGKLALRYVRPFEILERNGPVAYGLRLPKELSEEPAKIMDREVKTLKRSKIPIVKVRWNSKCGPSLHGSARTI
nr:hypothetical protein [Tanacetum cinerariifolium]